MQPAHRSRSPQRSVVQHAGQLRGRVPRRSRRLTGRAITGAVVCALGLAGGCGDNLRLDVEPVEPPDGPIVFEVAHYDYAFDLESRAASAVLTVEVTGRGDCITLPFRADALQNVTLDGEPAASVEVAVDGAGEPAAVTACGAGREAGETFALAADMTIPPRTLGASQVGYSVATDIAGAPFHYLVSWVGGCDQFGPCDSAPDRFARYRFTVRHPDGTDVLCPGAVTAGATETVCEFTHAGGPTYSTFGVVASPSFAQTSLGDWDGVRAVLYDAPQTELAAALRPEYHAGFVAFMQDWFGPYPYGDELRIVTGPTYWAGFEHPGNIVLNHRLHRNPFSAYTDPLAHTLNHEIAHQWAGDQTTLAGTYEFVWKEAMAEYLAFAFERDTEGDLATARAWKLFARAAAFYPVPAERPALFDYYGDVYGPGPMILFRQIEAMFGRGSVMAALRQLLGEPRALAVADVQAALERTTGASLAGYFDAWVYGEGAPRWPLFDVAVTDAGGGQVEVRVAQREPVDVLMGCAFGIDLLGAGGERHPVWIDLGPDGAAEHAVTATPEFPVISIDFDPEADCLAELASAAARAPAPLRFNPWVMP